MSAIAATSVIANITFFFVITVAVFIFITIFYSCYWTTAFDLAHSHNVTLISILYASVSAFATVILSIRLCLCLCYRRLRGFHGLGESTYYHSPGFVSSLQMKKSVGHGWPRYALLYCVYQDTRSDLSWINWDIKFLFTVIKVPTEDLRRRLYDIHIILLFILWIYSDIVKGVASGMDGRCWGAHLVRPLVRELVQILRR